MLRAEEILLYFAPATQRCGFAFLLPENLFAGDQQRLGTPPSSVPRPVLRGWHTDIKTTMRFYIHADADTQREAFAQIQPLQM
jgi:hypothetical protein